MNNTIKYKKNDKITVSELNPFFQNWLSPPSRKTREQLINGSDLIITARNQNKELVGFLSAITDNAMYAFITLLEVLENYQGIGIGKELLNLAIKHFYGNYGIVLITDKDKIGYYKKFGFTEIPGMQIQDFTYGGTVKPASD